MHAQAQACLIVFHLKTFVWSQQDTSVASHEQTSTLSQQKTSVSTTHVATVTRMDMSTVGKPQSMSLEFHMSPCHKVQVVHRLLGHPETKTGRIWFRMVARSQTQDAQQRFRPTINAAGIDVNPAALICGPKQAFGTGHTAPKLTTKIKTWLVCYRCLLKSAVETGQMSAAETKQLSAVETRRMSTIESKRSPI